MPVGAFELAAAVNAMPLIFTKSQDDVTLCGLLSLKKGKTYLLTPLVNGREILSQALLLLFPSELESLADGKKTFTRCRRQ